MDSDVCASVVIKEFKVIERVTRILHSMIESLPVEAQNTAAMGLQKAQGLQIVSGMKLLKEARYSADAAVKLPEGNGVPAGRRRPRSSR